MKYSFEKMSAEGVHAYIKEKGSHAQYWPYIACVTEEQALDVIDVLNLNCKENTHIERMQIELKMLTNKREKLEKFIIAADKFNQLHPDERTMMLDQLSVMKSYVNILNERITYAINKEK